MRDKVRIEITAEHLAMGGRPDGLGGFVDPFERAIAEVAEATVDIDCDRYGAHASIGDGEDATLVVDLPSSVEAAIRAFDRREEIEPFAFEIELPEWLVAFVRGAR